MMFTRCIFCHYGFEENEALEHLRAGRHFAFDPMRGRLWHICPKCHRWTLTPIEERWEALEELERIATDRGRLLAKTDNIALLRSGRLKIVRVGRAERREEAWWRYGRQFKKRRTRYQLLSAAGIGAAVYLGATGVVAGGLGYYLLYRATKKFPNVGRRLRFGKTAWRGVARCPGCGNVLDEIEFDQRYKLTVWYTPQDELALYRRCPTCRRARRRGGFLLTGSEGDHVLRRLLAYNNFAGATETELKHATTAIDHAGSPEALARRLADRQVGIGKLIQTDALALEIAVNEENERRLLEMELAELEARWRQEEEIASIVDGELTPVSGLSTLIRAIS